MKKSDMTILQDTREQKPLTFPQAKVLVKMLKTGDYSLEGFEDKITIERKSLPDLLGSLGNDRDRFIAGKIQRMQAFEYAGVVIEASMQTIANGNWRSEIHPASVMGSLQALSSKYGIHIFFADNRELAAKTVEGLLFQFLRKQHELHERLPLLNL
ncbi:MAG: hypothetical protein L3J17_13460 [Candidatus Jettenia sp.]|nr:MAG: hypothetical protein L3J17_13460 [Candidatus Jettenia sp.]